MTLIKSLVTAPNASGMSYYMIWHHLWATSPSIAADTLWMHHISHWRGRVSVNTYYVVSGILSEESVAGLSCPIYAQISFLYLLMWTSPFEWILIMLSEFSLEKSSTGLSCSISFQMSPPLFATVYIILVLLAASQVSFWGLALIWSTVIQHCSTQCTLLDVRTQLPHISATHFFVPLRILSILSFLLSLSMNPL